MVKDVLFKKIRALKIENEDLKVIVIPELGGKIASLIKKNKDFELFFQAKEDNFSKPELYSGFSEFDASGFDDCFPTVDCCTVNINGREIKYPDHGEIWTKSMKYEITESGLKLWCDSEILSYSYEKTISIDGESLSVDYKITNTGSEPFPCIWTMHGLINPEDDMEIFFPAGTTKVINVQDSTILGRAGEVHSFPDTTLADGSIYRLNKIKPADAEKTEKYYVNDILPEGICGVYYPSKDLNLKIHFNKDKLPYLGLWITEGGFRGDYNLALEPSTGFYDSIDIARKNGKLQILEPAEILEFTIKIKISDGNYIP